MNTGCNGECSCSAGERERAASRSDSRGPVQDLAAAEPESAAGDAFSGPTRPPPSAGRVRGRTARFCQRLMASRARHRPLFPAAAGLQDRQDLAERRSADDAIRADSGSPR